MNQNNVAEAAQNKRTARAFIAAMSQGRRDVTLLTEDASWWVPGRGVLDRETFFALGNAFRSALAGPFTLTVTAATAEEDRVALEASGRATLKDGRVYANDYHFLFHFRNGRIAQVREHNNSLVPHLMLADVLPPMPGLDAMLMIPGDASAG